MRTTESRKAAALRGLREGYDTYLALVPHLRDNHAAASSRYAPLRSFCDSDVVHREWSRNPRYEPDPFYFVLGDCRRGKPYKCQPEKLASAWPSSGSTLNSQGKATRSFSRLQTIRWIPPATAIRQISRLSLCGTSSLTADELARPSPGTAEIALPNQAVGDGLFLPPAHRQRLTEGFRYRPRDKDGVVCGASWRAPRASPPPRGPFPPQGLRVRDRVRFCTGAARGSRRAQHVSSVICPRRACQSDDTGFLGVALGKRALSLTVELQERAQEILQTPNSIDNRLRGAVTCVRVRHHQRE